MKTLKEIAKIILERRARMNPTVMQGEMLTVLGEEELCEALAKRWLIPDYDSGYLTVTNQDSAVMEMQEAAALPDAAPAPDTLKESRSVSMGHASRTIISEIAAPGTGGPSPGFSAPPPPATPTSSAPPNPNSASIGDDVTIVDNNKSYQAKVQKQQPNGKYRLSFGNEKPGMVDRDYSADELKVMRNVPGQPVRVS